MVFRNKVFFRSYIFELRYNIMKNSILSLLALSCIFSCGKEEKNLENSPEIIKETALNKDFKIETLETEASRLRGGNSIKSVEFKDGKVTINYVANYEEYKKLNPNSSLSESELKAYWETGDSIEKSLIDGSVRIMKKLDFVNCVNIILPFGKNIYEVSINKSNLEKFIGKDFKFIKENWNEAFLNPYVYDKNGRQIFFRKFGKKI